MFEQERLRGDGAYATGAEQLCAGDHQVNGEDENFAHRANGTITAGAFKTARRRRIGSHYEFAPDSLTGGDTAALRCGSYQLADEPAFDCRFMPALRYPRRVTWQAGKLHCCPREA